MKTQLKFALACATTLALELQVDVEQTFDFIDDAID